MNIKQGAAVFLCARMCLDVPGRAWIWHDVIKAC